MSLKPEQKEYRLQVAVVEHLTSAFSKSGLTWFHIPNRGGSASDGFFKQQMGARKGASDLVFGWGVHKFGEIIPQAGLIELKVDGGLSADQNKFLSRFHACGWKTAVCRSVRGVHHTLALWGLIPSHDGIQEPIYESKEELFKIAHEWYKPGAM